MGTPDLWKFKAKAGQRFEADVGFDYNIFAELILSDESREIVAQSKQVHDQVDIDKALVTAGLYYLEIREDAELPSDWNTDSFDFRAPSDLPEIVDCHVLPP